MLTALSAALSLLPLELPSTGESNSSSRRPKVCVWCSPTSDEPRIDTCQFRVARTLSIGLAILCLSGVASAQEAQPAAERLRDLDGTLQRFSSEHSDYRMVGGVASLALGAATIPAGVHMIQDDSADPLIGRWVVLIGMTEVLMGGLHLTMHAGPRGDFEDLTDLLEEERLAGKTPSQIVATVENEWADLARQSRLKRRITGVTGMVFGGALVGAGLYFTFNQQTDFTTNERYGYSAAALTLGMVYGVASLQAFFLEEPIEATYRAYMRGHTPTQQQATWRLRNVGYAPLPGGGAVQLGMAF